MSSIDVVLPGEALSLSPESSGFAHGYALFETLRFSGGRLEFWEAHWSRLSSSASAIGIAFPFKEEEVLDGLKVLAEQLPCEATVKLSLLKEGEASRLCIYSRPSMPVPESVGLLVGGDWPINESSALAGHKTHNYLENLLALKAAQIENCYDALRTNTKGQLAEGAISNVFFYRNGKWMTPARECGLLPGVIREALLERLEVEEGSYHLSDLLDAEAVYLTNSSVGLLPVDWISCQGQRTDLLSREHRCLEPAHQIILQCRESTGVQISGTGK